jgi:hypothetical protein
MLDLDERVSVLLRDFDGVPWLPQITSDLAATRWDKLAAEIGVHPDNYGTSRIIRKNTTEAVEIVTCVKVNASVNTPVIPIQTVRRDLIGPYCGLHINFYSAEEILDSAILSCVHDAFNLISQIPSLMRTVAVLVRALHLIKPVDANHDVSFSEPSLPFSAFVSVPDRRIANDASRVAESIVHEAMHLQLTLIEHVVSLLASSKQRHFSPWREEFRNSQGLLHGLYVFRVVDCFFEYLLRGVTLPLELSHIVSRRCEIGKQFKRIESFQFSSDLTLLGACFVKALLFPSPTSTLNRNSV